MAKKARKIFNIEEQKAKEVITAINVVAPVIPLIREWGKYEKELSELTEKIKELSKITDAMSKTIAAIDDDSIGQSLQQELNKKFVVYEIAEEKRNELQILCENIEKEVMLYQKYSKLYGWVTHDDLKKVLELKSFENDEELLSIMFFIYNIKTSNVDLSREKSFIEDRFSEKQKMFYFILDGWNKMLDSLKSNKI